MKLIDTESNRKINQDVYDKNLKNFAINSDFIKEYCKKKVQPDDKVFLKNCNINSVWGIKYNRSLDTYSFINNNFSSFLGENFENRINADLEQYVIPTNSIGDISFKLISEPYKRDNITYYYFKHPNKKFIFGICKSKNIYRCL